MVYLFNFEGEGILILFIAINAISIRAQIAEIVIIFLIVNYYIVYFGCCLGKRPLCLSVVRPDEEAPFEGCRDVC